MSLRVFLQLLQSALWGIPLRQGSLETDIFRKLMRRARKQAVTGFITDALVANNIRLNKHDAVECLVTLNDIEDTNRKINKALHQLANLLEKENIPYIVVKGQTFLPLYRKGEYRNAGDIDFYCPPQHFEKARNLITTEWQVEMEADEEEAQQHLAFTHEDVDFEMHFCLKKFTSNRNQRVFNELLDNNTPTERSIDGRNVSILEPDLEILYTFLHLYHHLINKGVALRQFCDLAVLLQTQQYDADSLEDMLTRLDHIKAFKAVEAVLVEVLGLSENRLPIPISDKDRRYITPILKVVLRHGNFGFYGNKHKTRSGWGYYKETLQQKISYLKWAYTLAPREARSTIFKALPQKIYLATRRQRKKEKPK